MLTCGTCQARTAAPARFCWACGGYLVVARPFCPWCGGQNSAGYQFCVHCRQQPPFAVATRRPRPTGEIVASLICTVLALGLFPPVLGGIAIYLGYRVSKRDQQAGTACMIVAGVAMAIGTVMGVIFSPWG